MVNTVNKVQLVKGGGNTPELMHNLAADVKIVVMLLVLANTEGHTNSNNSVNWFLLIRSLQFSITTCSEKQCQE